MLSVAKLSEADAREIMAGINALFTEKLGQPVGLALVVVDAPNENMRADMRFFHNLGKSDVGKILRHFADKSERREYTLPNINLNN